MVSRSARPWQHLLAAWIRGVERHPRMIVLLALAAAGWAGLYAARHLRIDTDRDKMISSELAFRQTFARYKREFPQFTDNLVLVVDAQTPERALSTARAVAARLAEETDTFQSVYLPRGNRFLERHALLFLGIQELEDLADRLAQVQPFFGKLSRDRSLRGLFWMLQSALEERQKGTEVDLAPILTRIDAVLEATLAGRRAQLSWQELMADRDPTPDDRRQFIYVKPQLESGRLFPAGEAMRRVKQLRTSMGLDGTRGISLRITGGMALAHEELESVARGANVIGLLVLVMVGTVLFVGLRSKRLVLATLVTLLVGLAFTAAFAALAIGHLNLISVVFAVLYLGLGVDYGIHFCLRYQELAGQGEEHAAALRTAGADVGNSLVLCSLTTAIGFYAFVPTAYSGVSELGLIAGTGMFISLFTTLTLLPALLSLSPLVPKPRRRRARPRFGALMDLPLRRPRTIGAAALLAGLLSLIALPQLRFDTNPLHLRDPKSESVQTFEDLLATSRMPPWGVTVLAHGPDAAQSAAEKLRALKEVDTVLSLATFVPEDQDEKLEIIDEIAQFMGPELERSEQAPPTLEQQREQTRTLRAALDRYLQSQTGRDDRPARGLRDRIEILVDRLDAPLLAKLENALLATLPENLARLKTSLETGPIGASSLPPELALRWRSRDRTHRLLVFPREVLGENVEALTRFVRAVQSVTPDATGSPVLMIESGQAVVRAFVQALTVAVIAAGVILMVLVRDFVDVLLILAPLILAGLLTGAALVLFGIPFNFANVIALPLLLGVGVDNGIHMVDRARRGRAGNLNPLQTSTARAVIYSALTTLCSFGNLALSPHRGTASMGLLLLIGISLTVLCTLAVVPALLAWRHGPPQPHEVPIG